jgi:anti-anti-sigma regulatory factor
MPTQITQIDDDGRERTVFRVEGDMMLDDALLLEKIALEMRAESGHDVAIDLADLDFLDSESATVLKRLKDEHGLMIEGMEIFLQTAVNDVEKNEA